LDSNQSKVAKNVQETPYDSWDDQQNEYHTRYAVKSYNNYSPYAYGTTDLAYYGNFFNAPGYGMMWQPYLAGMDGIRSWTARGHSIPDLDLAGSQLTPGDGRLTTLARGYSFLDTVGHGSLVAVGTIIIRNPSYAMPLSHFWRRMRQPLAPERWW
jgi:hypothetical protein